MSLRENVINLVLKDTAALKAIPPNGIRQRSVGTDTGTRFPIGAIAGDQYIYDAGSGVRWLFVHTGAPTDPWSFIGGPPLFSIVATSESRANTAYGALATAGPSITVPIAGEYDVAIGAKMNNDTDGDGARMSYDIGATGAVDADSIECFQTGATSVTATHSRSKRQAGLTAVALTAKYKTTVGGTAFFSERWMSLTPVRVGA